MLGSDIPVLVGVGRITKHGRFLDSPSLCGSEEGKAARAPKLCSGSLGIRPRQLLHAAEFGWEIDGSDRMVKGLSAWRSESLRGGSLRKMERED